MRTTFFAFADLKYMFIVKIDLKAFLKATIRIANVFTNIDNMGSTLSTPL